MQRLFGLAGGMYAYYGNVGKKFLKEEKKQKKKVVQFLAYLAQVRSTKRAKATLHSDEN